MSNTLYRIGCCGYRSTVLDARSRRKEDRNPSLSPGLRHSFPSLLGSLPLGFCVSTQTFVSQRRRNQHFIQLWECTTLEVLASTWLLSTMNSDSGSSTHSNCIRVVLIADTALIYCHFQAGTFTEATRPTLLVAAISRFLYL